MMFVAENGSCSFNSLVWLVFNGAHSNPHEANFDERLLAGTHHQLSIKITNILPTVHNVKSLQDDLLFRINSRLSCARQQD